MFAGVLVGLVAAIAQYPGERNDPDACRFDMSRGGMTLAVGLGEIAVAPGETVPVRPSWTPYPSAFDPVPARCLNGWRVSDAKTARLAKDRASLRIADDAAAGTVVTLTARYRGETVTQRYRVIHPVASPLLGIWRQRAADCPGGDEVFELAFRRDGGFTVTFDVPMHDRVDYRGSWRVEGARLIVDGIHDEEAPPADRAAASDFAIGEDGLLRFATPWFGHRAQPACTAPFKR